MNQESREPLLGSLSPWRRVLAREWSDAEWHAWLMTATPSQLVTQIIGWSMLGRITLSLRDDFDLLIDQARQRLRDLETYPEGTP